MRFQSNKTTQLIRNSALQANLGIYLADKNSRLHTLGVCVCAWGWGGVWGPGQKVQDRPLGIFEHVSHVIFTCMFAPQSYMT